MSKSQKFKGLRLTIVFMMIALFLLGLLAMRATESYESGVFQFMGLMISFSEEEAGLITWFYLLTCTLVVLTVDFVLDWMVSILEMKEVQVQFPAGTAQSLKQAVYKDGGQNTGATQPVIIESPKSGTMVCPACGKEQTSNRTTCFFCGKLFVD